MSEINITEVLAPSATNETRVGRDPISGKFQPGNTYAPGRRKGSRNKMTQRFLDRVQARTEDGLSMEEILMDMAQDPEMVPDLRFKAAKTILELTLPKASSVEVIMDDKEKMTKDQIDSRLKELLAVGLATAKASTDSEEDED